MVLDGRQRRRLAITFIAIWRQLRLQRAATGYTQLTDLGRIYRDEPMVRMQYEIIKALHEGRDPAAVPPGAATYVVDFWEQVATLVRLRQIDREMLFMTLGMGAVPLWTLLRPFMDRIRSDRSEPKLGEQFEWLAGVMADRARRAGYVEVDADHILPNIGAYYENLSDRLRSAEELRRPIRPRVNRRASDTARSGP